MDCPIPGYNVECKEDSTLLAGKYRVRKGESILLFLGKAHKDPAVYGNDAEEFKPERMLDENFERIQKEFPNSWKPFGNGARACIGRPFAWQEALLSVAMLLQNFNFIMDDPSYTLKIHETLTIKPEGFNIRAMLRHDMTPVELENRLNGTPLPAITAAKMAPSASSQPSNVGKAISILYGSNSGTCEALAHRLAGDAAAHGFTATAVQPLDAVNEKLPTDQPVVIVTASYEGQAPDNATHFVSWMETLKGQEMKDVSYAVFGCGKLSHACKSHPSPLRMANWYFKVTVTGSKPSTASPS